MKEKATSLLGVLLVVLFRPCCAIPIAISLFGVSTTSLAGILYPYRWLILASAALSFTVAGFFTFRAGVNWLSKILWIVSLVIAFFFIGGSL